MMVLKLPFTRLAFAAWGMLAALLIVPQPAEAQVRMCNETSYVLHAAAAFETGRDQQN